MPQDAAAGRCRPLRDAWVRYLQADAEMMHAIGNATASRPHDDSVNA